MAKGNAIPTKAREVVRQRDSGICQRCGMGAGHLHHRVRRREGGHGYEILVSLCPTCHGWVHANPKQATERGFIVSTHEKNPESVPVRTYAGPVLLNTDGTASPLGWAA